ncbi:hypothetical protein HNR46_001819 [Haloferula luteola]|uniref:Uncharacterized protein n=1 Tax=Haloferula luteola TaxID=595692 RepID=A0A840V0R0_9BACT|nr:hypothetical protein [Haloferula luteola]MBB5351582.1 hypothetical protein [Haloferula luteola]
MKTLLKWPMVVIPAVSLLPAATQVHPTYFSKSNADAPYQGSGNEQLVGSDYFVATLQPFDEALGTLISFSVSAEMDAAIGGTVGENGTSGSTSGSISGDFFLNDLYFASAGGGYGNGGLTGTKVEVPFSISPLDELFQVSEPFDEDYIEVVTGDSPYQVIYDSPMNVFYNNMSDLVASVEGNIVVTYTYETSSGEIRTLRVVGILRNVQRGEVTVEWTSQPGKTYTLEAGSSLTEGSLMAIDASVEASEGETTSYTEAVESSVKSRFYRVRENE